MNPSWHIVLCNVGGANAAKDATRTNIEAACAFKPTAAGAEENYIGTVHYRGVGKEVLTAKVVPPANTKPSGGWLEQSYIADALPSNSTVRLFVGQTNHTIVLQLEMDPNVPGSQTISVSRLDLKLTAIPAGTAQGPQK
jgi:hypothetical protein